MSKKLGLLMNRCQPKTSQNHSTISKPSARVQNRVFKATASKITKPLEFFETLRPNGYNGDLCTDRRSDEAFKFCNIEETTKCSLRDLLLNDSIGIEVSEHIGFAMVDNLVETGATISTSVSTLVDQKSPHSDCLAGDAATLEESLLYLNDQLSPVCNQLHSPSECSTDFASEDFYSEMEEPYDRAQNLDWIFEFYYLQK